MNLIELKDDRSEKIRYDYANYPIYVRRALLSDYPDYAAPIHWHDDIEFLVVLSGKMRYNVNGEIILLNENEGIIVNTRQLHFGFSSERMECDFICIILHPSMLCATMTFERDFVLPLLGNRSAPFVKLTCGVAWQNEILECVRHIYEVRDKKTAPLKTQSYFLNIWAELFDNIPHESPAAAQNTNLTVLKNMVGFIQQNYTEKITLADIAASGAVGQSKCCKVFAKYIGQTPNVYLTLYRLDKSVELLKQTDMTITEIANAVGFGGSSYFAETFRRWRGESPSEYRKNQALPR